MAGHVLRWRYRAENKGRRPRVNKRRSGSPFTHRIHKQTPVLQARTRDIMVETQIGSDRPQMGQIGDFLRPVLVHFGLMKDPDLSILVVSYLPNGLFFKLWF